ncbi:MAG: cyclodeaminase/cyclohydrolase family protein [bacterium]|nr:cyclodeaminase/cyclohydrolase family protein [bacterium]
MKFEEMTVGAFIDELASNSPAPGGGSVAALCGALASGLTSMVGNLTVGKEKYKDNWETMEKVFKESEALRAEFVKLMNDDTDSFNVFMAAMKMPKETDEQKAVRKAAMAEASKTATDVPLRTLEACAGAAKLACEAASFGNPNAASDAGSAALLADAAGKAASYNVRINLPGVKDEVFAAECRARMAKALEEIAAYSVKTAAKMEEALG